MFSPSDIFCVTKCCNAIMKYKKMNSLFCLHPSSLLFPSFCVFLQHSPCVQPGAVLIFFLLRAEHESDFLDRLCSPRRFCSIPPSWWTCRVTTRFLLETRLHWEESKDGEGTHKDTRILTHLQSQYITWLVFGMEYLSVFDFQFFWYSFRSDILVILMCFLPDIT